MDKRWSLPDKNSFYLLVLHKRSRPHKNKFVPFFPIRSSRVLEQVLNGIAGIGRRPHLTQKEAIETIQDSNSRFLELKSLFF